MCCDLYLSDHACLSFIKLDMTLASYSLLCEIGTASVEFFKGGLVNQCCLLANNRALLIGNVH